MSVRCQSADLLELVSFWNGVPFFEEGGVSDSGRDRDFTSLVVVGDLVNLVLSAEDADGIVSSGGGYDAI